MNRVLSDKQGSAALVLLILVSAGLYARTLSYGFVFDDNTIILRNPWITSWRYLPEIFTSTVTSFHGHKSNTYRPMLFVILSAEYHLFALKPWGYHLVNTLIHALNTILVFGIASFLSSGAGGEGGAGGTGSLGKKAAFLKTAKGINILPPFIAALIFAAHPVNTEAVSWASSVTELFYTLFFLLSFYIYIRRGEGGAGGAGGAGPLIASLLCFMVALLSKETAIVLPLLILAYDYSFYGKGLVRRYKLYVPYFAIALAFLALRTIVVGGIIHHKEVDITLYESVINVFPNITDYFSKLMAPVNLNALYVFHPVSTIFAPKAVTGVLISLSAVFLLVFYSERARAAFTGLLVLALPILPVLYIPAIAAAPMAERYLYLPSAGFSLIAAAFLRWVLTDRSRRIVLAASVALLALYSYGTLKRSEAWRDDLTLWGVTAKSSPESPIVHNNLAIELFYRGMADEAISEYRRAIELFEPYPSAHYNLGNAYFYKGMPELALSEYRRAVELEPDNFDALHNLADIYLSKGMTEEAIYYYERFMEYAPPEYEEYKTNARRKIEMLRGGDRRQ